MFFTITPELGTAFGTNLGAISYAGGTSPLVGTDISISFITPDVPVPSQRGLICIRCTLNFSSGPIIATAGPIGDPFISLVSYSFAGGGSLQIVGGATHNDGTPFLPEGSTLLTGVPTAASVRSRLGPNPISEVQLAFHGTLNPDLVSFVGLPAIASYTGSTLITTTELSGSPNPFVLSTFGVGNAGDLAHVFVGV